MHDAQRAARGRRRRVRGEEEQQRQRAAGPSRHRASALCAPAVASAPCLPLLEEEASPAAVILVRQKTPPAGCRWTEEWGSLAAGRLVELARLGRVLMRCSKNEEEWQNERRCFTSYYRCCSTAGSSVRENSCVE